MNGPRPIEPVPAGRSPSLVTVIVPVRNEAEHLAEQLHALAAQDYSGVWELIVADNGSTDASRDVAAARLAMFPAARLVDATRRPGPGYARNAGARAAAGDFLAFCDADDVVSSGWLRALVEAGRNSHLVTGRMDVGRLNGPLSRWHEMPPVDGPLVGHDFLPFASGGNCAIWRDVFDTLGGFDDRWLTGQDVEFSWRAQLTGYRLSFARDAVVHQRFPRRLSSLARQHFLWGRTNVRLFRAYRAAGMPRSSVWEAVLAWSLIVFAVVVLWSPRTRDRWTRSAALRAGQLAESVAQRAVYL